jgi:2-polyprenyl-3-methyl-5-hydroxy-6-metoxy-1,4-benzoquinol methylase
MSDKRGPLYSLLNRPVLFNTLRSALDGGQVKYIAGILKEYPHDSVLDIGCGCGAFSRVSSGEYTGIDYSERFIDHARRKYGQPGRKFLAMDVLDLDIKRTYDVSMMINTMHHLADGEAVRVLKAMNSITKKLVLIHDLVPQRNLVSKFFYGIDRGVHIRPLEDQRRLIEKAGLTAGDVRLHRTFPGIYLHSTILCIH